MSAYGVLAAGVQAAGNIVSSGLGSSLNYKMNEANNQRMIDLYHMQNAYNTPESQVQRLLNAGLNPAMMYGNGIMNEAAPAPQLNPSKVNFDASFDPSTLLLDAQTRLLDSQAEAQDALASNYETDNQLKIKQMSEIDQRIAESRQNIKESINRISKMWAEIKNMSLDGQVKIAQATSITKTWQQNERHINALCDNLRADKEYKSALAGLTDRELWERAMSWQYRLAGLDLSNRQVQSAIGFTDAQTTSEWFKQLESSENINNLKLDGKIKSFESTLLGFDVNERTLGNRSAVTDNAIANTPIGGFLLYSGHVLGKFAGPLLGQTHFGFGYNKSVIKKK